MNTLVDADEPEPQHQRIAPITTLTIWRQTFNAGGANTVTWWPWPNNTGANPITYWNRTVTIRG